MTDILLLIINTDFQISKTCQEDSTQKVDRMPVTQLAEKLTPHTADPLVSVLAKQLTCSGCEMLSIPKRRCGIYMYNRIIFGHKKEGNPAVCDNMDGP